MRTVEQASSHTGISKKLIRAVLRQLGDKGEELASTLRDIASHGADSGWSGFTYYKDTCRFFKRNRKEIVELAKQQADDLGSGGVIQMVLGFRCAKDVDATEDDVARVLYGNGKGVEIADQIENCMAWYALEEVARAMSEDW